MQELEAAARSRGVLEKGFKKGICKLILPQDESSPYNMKLTDHHMLTPFPP